MRGGLEAREHGGQPGHVFVGGAFEHRAVIIDGIVIINNIIIFYIRNNLPSYSNIIIVVTCNN